MFKSVIRGPLMGLTRRLSGHIRVAADVSSALMDGRPVVALESTIVSHGMPYPDNVRMGEQVEQVIRSDNGVTPATIALINGVIKVGLSHHDLNHLADSHRSQVIKASTRDLPWAIATSTTAGTTVSATSFIAHKVGINVFATGGIGGVHRHGQDTMDISNDLIALSQTPITIVSSGVKSILDIPRTLEYLETVGVTVVTFSEDGQSDFPAFFTRKSGFRSPLTMSSIEELCNLIKSRDSLKLKSAILVANPIPKEFELPELDSVIEEAVKIAQDKKVIGKDITPFLLATVKEMTEGKSLTSNIGLMMSNAKLAARIANELATPSCPSTSPVKRTTKKKDRKPEVVVVGGCIIDYVVQSKEVNLELIGSSFEAKSFERKAGGVGRNLASALAKIGHDVLFISATGKDDMREVIFRSLSSDMTRLDGIKVVNDAKTSSAFVLMDGSGDFRLMVGDLSVVSSVTPDHILQFEEDIIGAKMVVFDANIPLESMAYLTSLCSRMDIPTFYEPTDPNISAKFMSAIDHVKISYSSPNLEELKVMTGFGSDPRISPSIDELLDDVTRMAEVLVPSKVSNLIVTLGRLGCVSFDSLGQRRYFPAEKVDDIINVSGAGDCFSSGFISGLLRKWPLDRCVQVGQVAARKSLQSMSTTPDTLRSITTSIVGGRQWEDY